MVKVFVCRTNLALPRYGKAEIFCFCICEVQTSSSTRHPKPIMKIYHRIQQICGVLTNLSHLHDLHAKAANLAACNMPFIVCYIHFFVFINALYMSFTLVRPGLKPPLPPVSSKTMIQTRSEEILGTKNSKIQTTLKAEFKPGLNCGFR